MKLATVLLCVCGVAAGFVTSFLWTPRYTAAAKIELIDRAAQPQTADERRAKFFAAARAEVLSAESLSGIRPGRSPEATRRDIAMSLTGSVCTIAATDSDRRNAQRLANSLIAGFLRTAVRLGKERSLVPSARLAILDRLDWLEARTAKLEGLPLYMGDADDKLIAGYSIGVEVLDPPSVPLRFEGRWHMLFALAGGLLGWCAAGLLRMRISRRQSTV